MIESSRKHGPFDSRYPRKHPRLTFAPTSARRANQEAQNRLNWHAFSTRFCPGHDRHDLHVLEAYEAYRDGSQAYELYNNGLQAYETHRREAERSQAALVSAALEVWEGEGGAPLEPRTRARRSRQVAPAPDRAGIA
jgi:hypothetical protein